MLLLKESDWTDSFTASFPLTPHAALSCLLIIAFCFMFIRWKMSAHFGDVRQFFMCEPECLPRL